MMSAQGKRSHLARLTVTAAAILVAVAVLAAPALAAPHPTTLTAHANSTVLNYGGGTLISAVLTDTTVPVAVGGQWVLVEQSTSSASGPWLPLYKLTAVGAAYTTGTYSGPVLPKRSTWYHFVFEATPEYAASTSAPLLIQVKPLLGKPGCPATIKLGKMFTVKGTLKPAFPKGARTVKVKAFKMNSKKKWVALKTTYKATNANYSTYTQYRLRIKLKSKGKYRFQAQTTTSTAWAAAVSAYSRTLTVK